MQIGQNNPEDVARLINSLTLRAWQDAKFADDLREKPVTMLSGIAKEFGVRLTKEEAETFCAQVPVTPIGDMPSLDPAMRREAGACVTMTSECQCPPTITGGCICCHPGGRFPFTFTITIFGTPCAGCSNLTC